MNRFSQVNRRSLLLSGRLPKSALWIALKFIVAARDPVRPWDVAEIVRLERKRILSRPVRASLT